MIETVPTPTTALAPSTPCPECGGSGIVWLADDWWEPRNHGRVPLPCRCRTDEPAGSTRKDERER